jgi:oligosaccharide repeat unit polymerase
MNQIPLSRASYGTRSILHLQDGITRYPELGIAGTAIGTLLALSLIPEDPQPQGALFQSALAMTAGLAAAPVAAALKDPKSLLRGEHLLALSPVYWLLLDLLQGAYPMNSIEPAQVRIAFIGIGAFVVAVWIAALQKPWAVPATVVQSLSVDFSANTYFSLNMLAFVLGMLKFAIPCDFNVVEMLSYVGQPRWSAPWGRGQLGGWDAFLDHAQYFGYLLPALTVIVARRAGWADLRTLLSIATALVMALFLAQGGGRRIIGVIFGMGLILWMLTQQRLKTKHMAAVAIAVAALLAFMQVMLDYRGVGLGALLQKDRMKTVERRDYLNVDDNIFRFCQIVQLVPESHPYVYHHYLIWVLVRPIPRVFWSGKPVDPGFDLPATLGVKGVSYSFSTIGELYLSGGLVAIALGGWLYGRFSGLSSRLLTQDATFGAYVVYSILMMALFAGMRSMLDLVLISYVVLAWIGLLRLIIYFRGRSNGLTDDSFCTTNLPSRS